MSMQNFLSQKNACKNKSSKIVAYLVRVHNDKGLELYGREGTGEWTLFPSPTRGLISGLVPYYRLLYSPKLSSWSSSFISCFYLPAHIIPTPYHRGHELNRQQFLTIYFCTRFFWDKKFCVNIFSSQNCAHLFRHVLFLCYQNKCTNICDTNDCNAKNFDAKHDVAKTNPQKCLWIYFCNNNFCVTIFCLFILATVYSAAYIFVYLIKMTI